MGKDYEMGLGAIIALVGMIFLLIANFNRRAARRRPRVTPAQTFLAHWGAIAAFGFLAVGLLLLLKK
ncbi:MAG: hypothetical protein ACUVRZ_04790 [Desulfobacca sp.]|uniref:hypothetical protein n=1 Tax=Desulfobacca sp. TaxID=2067990 RepID=UPI00404AC543